MASSCIAETRVIEEPGAFPGAFVVNEDNEAAIYATSDAAIDAIERDYLLKVSKVRVFGNINYEAAYAAKVNAKATIYETASKAISAMAAVASENKGAIAAAAIATIKAIFLEGKF